MKWLCLVVAAACSSEPAVPTPTQLTDRTASELWVVDATLYFYDAYSDTDVWAVPIDGSAQPTRRFPSGVNSHVSFGSDRVYYTTVDSNLMNVVVTEPLAGGSAAVVASGAGLHALAATSQGVVLFASRIQLVPAGGGSAVDLGAGPVAPAVAADDAYAYWVEEMPRDCNRIALDGTRPFHLPCMGNTQIVPRGDVAYVRYNCPQDGACGAVSSLDFTTDVIHTLAMPDGVGAIAVDDAHVYWIEPHRVMRADLDGRSQVPLARTAADTGIQALTVDATSIYYSTYDATGPVTGRGIWSAPN